MMKRKPLGKVRLSTVMLAVWFLGVLALWVIVRPSPDSAADRVDHPTVHSPSAVPTSRHG
jgi:hypothetical protein